MFGSLLGGIASGIAGAPHASIPNLGLLGLSQLFGGHHAANPVQTTQSNTAPGAASFPGVSGISNVISGLGINNPNALGNLGNIGGAGGNILANADVFQNLIFHLLNRFGISPPTPPITGPHPQPGTQAYSNMNYPIGMTPGAGQF